MTPATLSVTTVVVAAAIPRERPIRNRLSYRQSEAAHRFLQERFPKKQVAAGRIRGKLRKIRLTNSVARNKIPLASETDRGFMFGNKKLNWTRLALVIGNEEA
jgi:hypothetical protein